jgi:hypothetical protein
MRGAKDPAEVTQHVLAMQASSIAALVAAKPSSQLLMLPPLCKAGVPETGDSAWTHNL